MSNSFEKERHIESSAFVVSFIPFASAAVMYVADPFTVILVKPVAQVLFGVGTLVTLMLLLASCMRRSPIVFACAGVAIVGSLVSLHMLSNP